ncbi:hypothetical protein ACVRYP_02560 [Streptococcus rifensis]
MKQGLVLFVSIYLLVTFGESLWRWHQKRYNVVFGGLGMILSGLLLLVTWSYAKAYSDWQISLYALGFMVLGSLPQLYEFRHHHPLTVKRHFLQFTWHIALLFLLYLLGQK